MPDSSAASSSLLMPKVYARGQCAVFWRTGEAWGGLSNMAPGYPLRLGGQSVATTEALYQACRYPHRPDIQAEILAQASPIAAKMKSRHHHAASRADWDVVRVPVMAWCLRLKLAQHWHSFGDLLLSTGHRPIVEYSSKDNFWGALAVGPEYLHGANVLGCLLAALRERLREPDSATLRVVTPPGIADFRLLGEEIGAHCEEGTQWSLGL